MEIMINGFWEEVRQGITLYQAIELFEPGHPELIVELNGRFVHFWEYKERVLSPGDRLELILAAFGG